MFAKLLSFIIIYILTLVNFIFVLLPFSIFILFNNDIINRNLKSLFFVFVFFASCLILLFFITNYLFDCTVKHYKKKCINCKKDKDFEKLNIVFEDIKKLFKKDNVELLIENSDKINAYAVGGLRNNCIVLTTGIMLLCKKNSQDEIDYYRLLSGIMGHEMSHIINKDFFPALLLIINNKVNYILSKTIFIILDLISRIIGLIPVVGNSLVGFIDKLYAFTNKIMYLFYNKIFLSIHHFIQLQISKKIEYRADKQGAYYCGGHTMSRVLSLLGSSGFFTIFSSHPKTSARIKKVKKIRQSYDYIYPVKFSNIYILFFIIIVVYLIKISYDLINFNDVYFLFDKIIYYKNSIKNKIFYVVNYVI